MRSGAERGQSDRVGKYPWLYPSERVQRKQGTEYCDGQDQSGSAACTDVSFAEGGRGGLAGEKHGTPSTCLGGSSRQRTGRWAMPYERTRAGRGFYP